MSPRTARAAAPAGTGDREVLRMVPPVVLWWVWVVFVVLCVVDFLVQGVTSARFGAVVSAILLLVTGLMYTLALRPCVVIGERELTVRNPFRSYAIPWPLIHAVDTGEWVRVHYYAPGGPGGPGGPQDAADPERAATPVSSAGDKTAYCWALYVSARARRKIVRGVPRPRPASRRRGLSAWTDSAAASGASARMPEEARYLASLPIAKAMATRLDSRAERERAKAKRAGSTTAAPLAATAGWIWPDIAAVAVPAIIMLVVALL
ncbi:MAG TPA: PH domain-containing protein [Trebonia sp.]|jgi:hypothetical protein|nr:PH domain-containing protein [Trebonia sp.]